MTTIAEQVITACEGAVAITLQGGYAVKSGGRRELFPTIHVTEAKRNKKGRVSLLKGFYPDGSGLTFRWSEARGPSMTACKVA